MSKVLVMNKMYIKRDIYLDKVKPFIGKDIIKVLIGQRRVGKSYLLFQIMDEIRKQRPKADIIYINKELSEFDEIKNHQDLLAYIKKHKRAKGKTYVFMDEIQDIEQFEKALRSLKAQGRYDLYCTGSNANLLSGELATYLSGRYLEIKIFSLSYVEFLQFHALKEDQDSFLKYIKYGGLPYLKNLTLDDLVVYDYLRSIYNTILLKDVVARYNIRNISFLENLVTYLADNIGSLVSAKRISDFLKSQRVNISPNVVLDYLSFLVAACFVAKVPRLDIQGKKVFEVNDKYYFTDLGLRHAIVGYQQIDINKVLENLVFQHLQVQGFKVRVGCLGDREIDFVAEKQDSRLYVQVAYHITEANREREFGNLLSIKDNYPKLVVSADELIDKSEFKGIKQVHIRDFLSSQQ